MPYALLILAIQHLFIDFASLAVLHSIYRQGLIPRDYITWIFLLYNFLAFALQYVVGYLADTKVAYRKFVVLSGIMAICGVVLTQFSPYLAVVLVGIANAIFHVGGGALSLKINPNKMAAVGIFVAPGAIGVTLGMLTGKFYPEYSWLLIIPLTILTVFIYFNSQLKTLNTTVTEDIQSNDKKNGLIKYIIVVTLLVILLRSLIGSSLILSWKNNVDLLLYLTLATALGKGIGGILADKFGIYKTVLTSLIIATPLLVLFNNVPILAIIGVGLFNVTMPITLYMVYRQLPKYPGFAFGLTCLALFLGYVIYLLPIKDLLSSPLMILYMLVLSIVVMVIATKMYFKR
jgi:FSR family fosmidomycin resistance protein-like MFS transporter